MTSKETTYSKTIKSSSSSKIPSVVRASNSSLFCLADKNRYIKGQIFKKNECTNCICKSDGKIVCEKLECEKKSCTDGSNLRYFSGVCCPLCESEVRLKYPFIKRIQKSHS